MARLIIILMCIFTLSVYDSSGYVLLQSRLSLAYPVDLVVFQKLLANFT